MKHEGEHAAGYANHEREQQARQCEFQRRGNRGEHQLDDGLPKVDRAAQVAVYRLPQPDQKLLGNGLVETELLPQRGRIGGGRRCGQQHRKRVDGQHAQHDEHHHRQQQQSRNRQQQPAQHDGGNDLEHVNGPGVSSCHVSR
jgi:hypothetical protein